MILGADGKKLSKRHGATSVEEYRDAGYLPDAFGQLPGAARLVARRRDHDHPARCPGQQVLARPHFQEPGDLRPQEARLGQCRSTSTACPMLSLPTRLWSPSCTRRVLIEGNVEYGEDWIDALAAIVKPRTKMPADAVTVAAPIFATAETLEYDEKSVNKGLAKEGMGAILMPLRPRLRAWTSGRLPTSMPRLEPLPEQMDLKKRVVFQAVRVAVCGNMVSPPLGETMALVGRDDCLARIDRARTMAL